MAQPSYPTLYQINTRVWLRERSRDSGRSGTLDLLDDRLLDGLAAQGFDWLWPLGVWQTGPAGRKVSQTQPDWRREFEELLPDLSDDDITGSPFAIQNYTVHRDFGGEAALVRLRERLASRDMRLLLDFVPNHTALDHPWVAQNPDYYIAGIAEDLEREPQNYCRVDTRLGPRILAHGRDPYFPGWPDTLQLNYRSQAFRQAMTAELFKIADLCDGVRCDMAMLLLPDVIGRTWGERSLPAGGTPPIDASFWIEAIARMRVRHPRFVFMAEVYWDLEWELQQQGFDYTYDKRLCDRLHSRDAGAVRGHLCAALDFQSKSVRFLENHDEPRAASAFEPAAHKAAALITYFVPGLRFFHEGQFEARRCRVPMHLSRRPQEPADAAIGNFYRQLLDYVKSPLVRGGDWRLLDCWAAWDNNPTNRQFVAFSWETRKQERLLVAVNYGPSQGQRPIRLPWSDLAGRQFLLKDRFGAAVYEREGSDLSRRGLYLDLAPWHYHIFEMSPIS